MASFLDSTLPDEVRVLMHLALDGEASAAQAAELERHLAHDAGARAEFERLKLMFETLDRVAPVAPPAGLVDLVVAQAKFPQENAPARQLSAPSRVISSQAASAALSKQGSSTPLGRIFSTVASLGAWIMSEQNGNTSSNRKLWIGGGAAAAAAAMVAVFTMGAPKVDDASGTIAPAKRFQAPQPAAEDVKVAAPLSTVAGPKDPPPADAVGAADSRTKPAAQSGVANSADGAVKNSAQSGATNSADGAVKRAQSGVTNSADGAARGAAADAANKAAANAANAAAAKAAATAADAVSRTPRQ